MNSGLSTAELIIKAKKRASGKRSLVTGIRGELLFERYFLENQLLIAVPRYDIHAVDFIVEWEGALQRVQVKTMTKQAVGNYYTKVDNSRTGEYKDKFDFYGLVNLDLDRIWLVPVSIIGDRKGFTYTPDEVRTRTLYANGIDLNPYLIN